MQLPCKVESCKPCWPPQALNTCLPKILQGLSGIYSHPLYITATPCTSSVLQVLQPTSKGKNGCALLGFALIRPATHNRSKVM
jgi:hypothetical protein